MNTTPDQRNKSSSTKIRPILRFLCHNTFVHLNTPGKFNRNQESMQQLNPVISVHKRKSLKHQTLKGQRPYNRIKT
ncbi:hypothetical protein CDL12_00299 [Handroanthus impetiginosus]|uniref:Uncharacterized protein n=1 Tax=Handroanthus impetiginosus TaxID=429701 RepID=A0A2G9IB07_9LAMI|nr:hypothetical protein CDL12_25308 [Handroanthus impetiginosus]PIN26942.1 hypothetical protein CDL12_00299 [Handroanthus impetiginosus]